MSETKERLCRRICPTIFEIHESRVRAFAPDFQTLICLKSHITVLTLTLLFLSL